MTIIKNIIIIIIIIIIIYLKTGKSQYSFVLVVSWWLRLVTILVIFLKNVND